MVWVWLGALATRDFRTPSPTSPPSNPLHLVFLLPLPHHCTQLYIYQLCRSLAYIHSLGICHRDIKVHPLGHSLRRSLTDTLVGNLRWFNLLVLTPHAFAFVSILLLLLSLLSSWSSLLSPSTTITYAAPKPIAQSSNRYPQVVRLWKRQNVGPR